MPNTLVHLGIQGLGSRLAARHIDIKWVFLGCIIPDLPWIFRRAVIGFGLDVDLYDLRLYTVVQASLLFCLILSSAIALVSEKPRSVFVILAANCFIHLLLDTVEIKWGNGVHLLAPLTWHYLSFDLIWPDSALIAVLSLIGLAAAVWFVAKPTPDPIRLRFRLDNRWIAAVFLVSIYVFAPLALLDGPYSSNISSIATLREEETRPGKAVSMDRENYQQRSEGDTVTTFTGERLRVTGDLRAGNSTEVSLLGEFVDSGTIRIHRLYEYRSPWRDLASYVGLGIFALCWLLALVRERGASP